jgi:hypothetical protein
MVCVRRWHPLRHSAQANAAKGARSPHQAKLRTSKGKVVRGSSQGMARAVEIAFNGFVLLRYCFCSKLNRRSPVQHLLHLSKFLVQSTVCISKRRRQLLKRTGSLKGQTAEIERIYVRKVDISSCFRQWQPSTPELDVLLDDLSLRQFNWLQHARRE